MTAFRSQETETPRRPLVLVALVMMLALGLLVTRLWYLQLLKGRYFADLSEHNRIRLQDTPPARGMIFDQAGRLLVDNQPAFDLAVVREDVVDLNLLLGRLQRLLALEPAQVQEKLRREQGAPPFVPLIIKTDLTWEELARVETYKYETPGLTLLMEPRRYYPHPSLANHLIGYTGEVTEAQLGQKRYKQARMGDRIGQYGVEMAWQDVLSGHRGGRQVEVDATGRPLKVLQQVPAQPGLNLYLTIDAELQRRAEEALGDMAGAVVALDVTTGRILALVSRPTFDQLSFVRGLSAKEWQSLVNDPFHPLENRALCGQYPPGSTYKIVTAIAGLMEGVITPESTFYCPGHYVFGGRPYHCWKAGGHGTLALHRAIVESCDVYFYRLGQKLGVDRLVKYARMLGLGEPTGLGIGPEKPGLVASSAWKKQRFGVPWQDGETLSVAIGQGFNLVTPIQMASLVAAVANGGKLWRPQVVLRTEQADGTPDRVFEPVLRRKVAIKPSILEEIRQGLAGVVSEPRGTGRRAQVEGVTVGGKTGTAQVVRLDKFKGIKDIEKIPYRYRDHAWFVCFAPVDRPQIAVAVVAEHSGHGGSVAAPVAQRVLAAYFELMQPELRRAANNGREG